MIPVSRLSIGGEEGSEILGNVTSQSLAGESGFCREGRTDHGWNETVIVEPLARSTGHQTWFASNLVQALIDAQSNPMLVTFDGMNDDIDLQFRNHGCNVRRILPLALGWVRRCFGVATGVRSGMTASPSMTRWPFQMYLYNQLATVFSVLYACRAVRRGTPTVLHLLCPPSWLTLCCLFVANRRQTRVVITTFAAPAHYRGNSFLLKQLCARGNAVVVVQTEALAAAWSKQLNSESVRIIALPSEVPVYRGDSQGPRRLLDLPLDKPIVAVIGCIAPRKGYMELFHALRGKPKDFRILLTGDTGAWTCPDPEEVARESGWLDHTIIRRNFLPERLLPCLFSAVDAVALLYREPDGSSGILSLCQKYGVPVIATRFGEIGAKVRAEKLGVTVDPNNSDEVAAAVFRILNRSDNCDSYIGGRMAEPAVTRPSAEFSWGDIAVAHLRLYSDLRKTITRKPQDS